MEEIWKSIPEYEGFYEVSSFGRIRSIDRFVIYKSGKKVFRKGKERKLFINKHGYYFVGLNINSSAPSSKTVHTIVAKTFLIKENEEFIVNHKNGIKTDNRVENLEWVTRSYNDKHSFEIGVRSHKGSLHPRSKLTEDQVIEIKFGDPKKSPTFLSKKFNISKSVICDIRKGRIWGHIRKK